MYRSFTKPVETRRYDEMWVQAVLCPKDKIRFPPSARPGRALFDLVLSSSSLLFKLIKHHTSRLLHNGRNQTPRIHLLSTIIPRRPLTKRETFAELKAWISTD